MKNYIELKTNAVYPVFTIIGWNYYLLPVAVMECYNSFEEVIDTGEGRNITVIRTIDATLYLN